MELWLLDYVSEIRRLIPFCTCYWHTLCLGRLCCLTYEFTAHYACKNATTTNGFHFRIINSLMEILGGGGGAGAGGGLTWLYRNSICTRFSLLFPFPLASDNFGIVEPYPENIHPHEFTSAQVTCLAFDSNGIKTPGKIDFMRGNMLGEYTRITANGNLYFTNRTEEVDKGKPMS